VLFLPFPWFLAHSTFVGFIRFDIFLRKNYSSFVFSPTDISKRYNLFSKLGEKLFNQILEGFHDGGQNV